MRFKRRYELYWDFAEMCLEAGVKLITVELQLGHRPFMVTTPDNPYNVQCRTIEELWHKENLINRGVKRAMELDPLAREVAWIDADCFPMVTPIEWFEETWHALQRYEFVQMWEYLINFGPQNQPMGRPDLGFMATYERAGRIVPKGKTVPNPFDDSDYGAMLGLGRPGLAWAANIKTGLEPIGMLPDRLILGSGDWHLAHCLVGALMEWPGEFVHLNKLAKYLMDIQVKCERWIKRDVGFVPVTVGHWWHGNKHQRGYGTRGAILTDNQYDPYTDVKYDAQGVLQLETHEPRQIKLRDQIRMYFNARNEDSIDVLK